VDVFVGQVIPLKHGGSYRVTHVGCGKGTPPPGRPNALRWVEFDVLEGEGEEARVVDHLSCGLASWLSVIEMLRA
jgi:hypothetical protein